MPEMFAPTTEFVFDTCFPSGHLEFWYMLGLLTDYKMWSKQIFEKPIPILLGLSVF